MTEVGKHIIVEGTDATGKSSIADKLADRIRETGHEVWRLDEPDSIKNEEGEVLVPISVELRRIIKDGSLGRTALTNAFLFTASRLENWSQQTKPALVRGITVVQARSDMSSEVYQGYVEGLDIELIRYLTRLATDEQYMSPDLEMILDLDDEEERARRLANRGPLETLDTFESRGPSFQQGLLDGYRKIARDENLPIIMTNRPFIQVLDKAWELVEPLYRD